MTATPVAPGSPPWAFWSPAPDSLVESALDLARLRPGERFLDLGCGDGRVLVAAARRGAVASGIEIDPGLAGRARANLAAAGLQGDVREGDMFATAIEADVVYTYLTPVTLARLRLALLRTGPATRVVSPTYPIAGWRATASGGGCFLYELPPALDPPPAAPGWPWRALVLVLNPGRRNLIPLTLTADPGPVAVEPDGPLSRAAKLAVAADSCDTRQKLPVDFILNAYGAGTVIVGSLTFGPHELTVAAIWADQGHGYWPFRASQGSEFREVLRQKTVAARSPRNGADR